MEKICKYCNKKFNSDNIRKLFCNNNCKSNFGRYNKTKSEKEKEYYKKCKLCNHIIYSKSYKLYCDKCLILKNKEWKKKEYKNNKLKYSLNIKNKIINKYSNRLNLLDGSIWFKIKNHELYRINKNGQIFSARSNKILKESYDNNGYCIISLNSKNIIKKTYKIHRLVAKTFISNPHKKPQVNHKNLIKSDNRVENLEWVTSKENVTHYHNSTNAKYNKPNLAI